MGIAADFEDVAACAEDEDFEAEAVDAAAATTPAEVCLNQHCFSAYSANTTHRNYGTAVSGGKVCEDGCVECTCHLGEAGCQCGLV